MLGFGPLSSLYYMGFFPCCLKEEDKNARDALNQINNVGKKIIWHRDNRKRLVDNVKAAAFSFLKKKSSNSKNEHDTNNNGNNDNNNDNDPLVKAQFQVYDNEDGIPEILVAKRDIIISMEGMTYSDEDDGIDGEFGFGGFEDEEESSKKKKESSNKNQDKNKSKNNKQQISILLKRIHTVVPIEQDLITLNILEPDGQQTKEWVRFALGEQDNTARNMLVHNLQVLMEWDRQRRNTSGELEYDETSDAVTLRSRAQRAAHFARREIEMKQVKRSREERKAKYVQESGGLKYTAMAMAKNSGVS